MRIIRWGATSGPLCAGRPTKGILRSSNVVTRSVEANARGTSSIRTEVAGIRMERLERAVSISMSQGTRIKPMRLLSVLHDERCPATDLFGKKGRAARRSTASVGRATRC